jgi:hypothetical protein
MEQHVSVHHWKHEDGWQHIPEFLRKKGWPERDFREEVIGWHCWVYCDNHNEFVDWMDDYCPTADCTTRFNGGNPMVTVHITNRDEAAYFMLNFQVS